MGLGEGTGSRLLTAVSSGSGVALPAGEGVGLAVGEGTVASGTGDGTAPDSVGKGAWVGRRGVVGASGVVPGGRGRSGWATTPPESAEPAPFVPAGERAGLGSAGATLPGRPVRSPLRDGVRSGAGTDRAGEGCPETAGDGTADGVPAAL